MTYPIHDWRDRSKYPSDPFIVARPEFIAKRRECNYSDDEIRSTLWHWEFLRRHPLYQAQWANESHEYFSIFGVCGTPRPDPKTDCPADLLFRYELFSNHLQYPTMIDAGKPWPEIETSLKLKYDALRASKSPFELAMIAGYVPRPKLTEGRKRRLGKEKYSELLRVLDALAAGETLTQIARELRPALPENSLYNTATRLRNRALDLQATLTQIPRRDEPDTKRVVLSVDAFR